jgi:hypothetical protein
VKKTRQYLHFNRKKMKGFTAQISKPMYTTLAPSGMTNKNK